MFYSMGIVDGFSDWFSWISCISPNPVSRNLIMFSNLSIEHQINREIGNKTIVKHLTQAMLSLVAQSSQMFSFPMF